MKVIHDVGVRIENNVLAWLMPHVGGQGVGRHLVVEVEQAGIVWLKLAKYKIVLEGVAARVYILRASSRRSSGLVRVRGTHTPPKRTLHRRRS